MTFRAAFGHRNKRTDHRPLLAGCRLSVPIADLPVLARNGAVRPFSVTRAVSQGFGRLLPFSVIASSKTSQPGEHLMGAKLWSIVASATLLDGLASR
jgi:hypothetical protein